MKSQSDRPNYIQKQITGHRRTLLLLLLPALFLLLPAGDATVCSFSDNQDSNSYGQCEAVCLENGRQLDWMDWEGFDYVVQEDGSALISRGEYYAPYLMLHLKTDEPLPNPAAISARMRLESFSGQAYTLLTAYTANKTLSLVVVKAADGHYKLGIISDANETPILSESSFREGSWHDICLVLDANNGTAYGYVDGICEVSVDWREGFSPLQEIWTGAFWVGGSNAFGTPIRQEIAYVNLGTAMPALPGETAGTAPEENPAARTWLWLLPALILFFLLAGGFWLLQNRKRQKEIEVNGGREN
jgi:hypothetical protein